MQDSNKTVVGTYDTRDEALEVVHKLKDAGYQKENIILYANEDVTKTQTDYEAVNIEADTDPDTMSSRETSEDDQSLWEQIKNAFSSDTYDHDEQRRDDSYNREDDILYPYRDDIRDGKVVVVLDGYKGEDLDKYKSAGTVNETDPHTPRTTPVTTDDEPVTNTTNADRENDKLNKPDLDTRDNTHTTDKNIELKEEQLDVDTNEVKTGEVNVHKEVIKDTETVEVPVEREEVVVERKPVTDHDGAETDEITTEDTMNIPVKEDQIEVTKKPVVTEEVEVRKETHKDTKKVSEEVRHEELDVDTDGDVRVDDNTTNLDKDDTNNTKNSLNNYGGVRDKNKNDDLKSNDKTLNNDDSTKDVNDPLTEGRDFSREDEDLDGYKK